MDKKIAKTIRLGLKFLEKNQQKNGSFESLTSTDPNFSKKNWKTSSIFPSCLILSSLENLNLPKTKNGIVKFLLSQKNEYWSFNYWSRNSKEAKEIPYPDDLDTIFCALAGIFKNNPKTIDGKALAKIVTLLTFCEKKEGGPYSTWITPKNNRKDWGDFDLAVNSNIAFFLDSQGLQLDSINKLVKKAIQEKNFSSPYYYSEFSVIYFISRFFKDLEKEKAIKYLLSKKNRKGFWNNPLDTALAVCALLNFGFYKKEELKKPVKQIISSQSRNGSWKPFPFVVEFSKLHLAGSPALTTSFCLEALNKYQNIFEKNKHGHEKNDPKEESIKNEMARLFQQRISKFSPETKKKILFLMDDMLSSDKNGSISLLSYHFKKSLGKNGEKIPDSLICKLGLANLYGWIAYTIYDDFLDNEVLENNLPLANFFLRELSSMFFQIQTKNNTFFKIFQRMMDDLEEANFQETRSQRLKIKNSQIQIPQNDFRYRKKFSLATRSMGHAFGPIAILCFLGYGEKSKEIEKLTSFFENYICAKQLNDDIHDWEKDLAKGILNQVTSLVMKKFKEKYKMDHLDLKRDKIRIQELFWHEIIPIFCKEIIKKTNRAEELLKQIGIIKNIQIFQNLISKCRKIALDTMNEQKETLNFIRNIG